MDYYTRKHQASIHLKGYIKILKEDLDKAISLASLKIEFQEKYGMNVVNLLKPYIDDKIIEIFAGQITAVKKEEKNVEN